MSEPYIDGELGNCHPECHSFKDNFISWAQACVKCGTELPDMIQNLEELLKQANDAKDTVTDDAKAANLSGMQLIKAPANLATNTKKLVDGVNKLKTIPPLG